MRILHIIENLRGGGANLSLFALSKLSRRLYGHDHVVMTAQYDDMPTLPHGIAGAHNAGMRIVVSPEKPIFHREIDEADVVLVHWWGSRWLWGLRYRNMVPCRLGIIYHVAGDNEADRNENVITQVELDWPDVNIAVSQYTYDRVFRDLPDERKAWVLACACPNFERFTNGKEPIRRDDFRIGLTCSLAFNKLRRRWVQMCAEIAKEIPATFVACGTGRHNKNIVMDAHELGVDIEFKGFLDGNEYGDEIRTWDVMGYPTVRDAAPIGLMETMWFGVPPILFAHTAPAYMVQGGVTGFLARTEQQFIDRHITLYRCPKIRLELGENARIYAEKYFDPVKNAPDFEVLLQRLIALPKRRHDSQTQLRKERP